MRDITIFPRHLPKSKIILCAATAVIIVKSWNAITLGCNAFENFLFLIRRLCCEPQRAARTPPVHTQVRGNYFGEKFGAGIDHGRELSVLAVVIRDYICLRIATRRNE